MDGKARDFSTYLLPQRGAADIFFPQNFSILAALYQACAGGAAAEVSVDKSARFFRQYAELEATQTADGFNPLLDDFQNTSVLIGSTMSKDN